MYSFELAAPIISKGVFPKEKFPAERVGTEKGGLHLYLTSRAKAYCNGDVVITDGIRLSIMPATY